VALLTAMDRPLGRALGNALEIEETILSLQGKGPPDLMEVTLALADEMLLLGGIAGNPADARQQLDRALASGAALEMFGKLIEAQGGDRRIIDDPSLLPQAGAVEVYRAPGSGTIASVEPRLIGRAITELGGGRRTLDDVIDPAVGFVVTVKPGDKVTAGEPIASVFARDKTGIETGMAALGRAITVGRAAQPTPLISHRVTVDGIEERA
jgi:thymidine phosphorylase